jgi:molybdopterin-biosynthesis enzyme MoeA-like protein
MKSKDLEYQLLEARLEELTEREASRVTTLEGQLKDFGKSESDLRAQLSVYVDKFRAVQETLSKSNELFHSFRNEIEASSKKTKSLEQLCRALQTERADLRTRLQKYEAVEPSAEPANVE